MNYLDSQACFSFQLFRDVIGLGEGEGNCSRVCVGGGCGTSWPAQDSPALWEVNGVTWSHAPW